MSVDVMSDDRMQTTGATRSAATPAPDRAALRARLEETRAAFHRLLEASTGERWRAKSPTTDWTRGEVLVHLTWSLEELPREIESARRGKGMYNLPKWLAEPGSYWLNRWLARKSDPVSVRRRYDAAMDAALAALESVPDSDWDKGAAFYGHGFHSVRDLFDAPAEHLAEHAQGWNS